MEIKLIMSIYNQYYDLGLTENRVSPKLHGFGTKHFPFHVGIFHIFGQALLMVVFILRHLLGSFGYWIEVHLLASPKRYPYVWLVDLNRTNELGSTEGSPQTFATYPEPMAKVFHILPSNAGVFGSLLATRTSFHTKQYVSAEGYKLLNYKCVIS